jgi:hypothetical protein
MAIYLLLDDGGQIVATKLVLRPALNDCARALLATSGAHIWQIRSLRVELPLPCSSTSIDALLHGVNLPRCAPGATILQANGKPVAMCGRDATCANTPVSDGFHNLTSPTCSCEGDYYVPGGLAPIDATLAPYLYDEVNGCLRPVRSSALTHVVESEVVVSLTKTQAAAESRALNLTFELSGTDWRVGSDYIWTVQEVAPASWLRASQTSGSIVAPSGSVSTTDVVPITVESFGLRDASTTAADVQILFTPTASVPHRSLPPQLLSMTVRIFVRAEAVAATSSFESSNVLAHLLDQASLPFTARDVDGLALDHGEVERFSAAFTHDETGEQVATSIAYRYDGVYTVSGTPGRLGAHQLRVFLDFPGGLQPLPSSLRVDVICKPPRVPLLGDNGCGCSPGTQPDQDYGCASCPSSSFQPSVSNRACRPCRGAHTTSAPGAVSSEGCVW